MTVLLSQSCRNNLLLKYPVSVVVFGKGSSLLGGMLTGHLELLLKSEAAEGLLTAPQKMLDLRPGQQPFDLFLVVLTSTGVPGCLLPSSSLFLCGKG